MLDKHLLNLEEHWQQVLKWNTLAGNTSTDLIPLYKSLVEEELLGEGELVDSYEKGDLVGFIDGICDVFWVNSFSTYLLTGYPFTTGFEDLLGSELVEIDLTSGIPDYVTALKASYKSNLNIQDILTELIYSLSIDMNKCLNEVNRSNFSKFINVTGRSGKFIQDTGSVESNWILEDYKSKGKDIKDVTFEEVYFEGENFLVFRNEKGKIVKPSTFTEPDLSFLLEDQHE